MYPVQAYASKENASHQLIGSFFMQQLNEPTRSPPKPRQLLRQIVIEQQGTLLAAVLTTVQKI